MKVSWRTEFPIWILLVGMWVAAGLAWPTAPARIPTHWGLDGQVNGYGGKFEALLLLPLIALLIYLIMLFAPRLDPGRLNYEKFAGAYTVLRLAVVAFLAVIYGLILAAMRGRSVDMQRMAPLLAGLLIVVIGSVIGKIQPTWFVGIRTPWTLSSKTSWEKTHRAAGRILTAGGLLLAAAGLSGSQAAVIAAFALFLAGMLGVVVYSYLVWRTAPDRIPPGGTS